jgi:tetratricopeptide (TPR) repeat protein
MGIGPHQQLGWRHRTKVQSKLEDTIRRWLEATTAGGLPSCGMLVEDALAQAGHLDADLVTAALPSALDSPMLDLLHAYCQRLARESRYSDREFRQLVATYEAVLAGRWEDDLFDERQELLSRLSFEAWSRCVRSRSFGEMRLWSRRCSEHVLNCESTGSFIALPHTARSQSLCDRFFCDSPVLLAFDVVLEAERNRAPVRVFADSTKAYDWIVRRSPTLREEESAFILGNLSLSAAAAARHLGSLADCKHWIHRAEGAFASVEQGKKWQALAALARVALSYGRHRMADVIRAIGAVASGLEELGALEELARCRFVEAMAMKEAGFTGRALELFEALSQTPEQHSDGLVSGLILVNIGEILASSGESRRAVEYIKRAAPVLEAANTPWAIADMRATVGEVLRDRGLLREAIENYRAAVAICDAQRMDLRAAYLRVVLAESLIAAKLERKAVAELLAALPILEREKIVPAAIAAVGLLRESLARQSLDPQLLRRLRESLAPSVSGARL